jgi:hypothetical protein
LSIRIGGINFVLLIFFPFAHSRVECSPCGSPVYSKRLSSQYAGSPNTSQILSLDSSGFSSCLQEIDLAAAAVSAAPEQALSATDLSESEDMFADEASPSRTAEAGPRSQLEASGSEEGTAGESQQSLSSLPLSVLDIKVSSTPRNMTDPLIPVRFVVTSVARSYGGLSTI